MDADGLSRMFLELTDLQSECSTESANNEAERNFKMMEALTKNKLQNLFQLCVQHQSRILMYLTILRVVVKFC